MNKYNFPVNNNLLSNIILKWKLNTTRFAIICILSSPKDYQNSLILREYRVMSYEENNKLILLFNEYSIWANEENISRMKKSKNYFIDAHFISPLKLNKC